MRRRALAKRIALRVLCGIVVFAALSGGWLAYQCSYSPFKLARGMECALDIPSAFKFCFVRVGTPESAIRARFGKPILACETTDPEWKTRMYWSRRCEWSVPPSTLTGRVIVYQLVGSSCGVAAYYFMDRNRRLKATFIGEFIP